MGLLTIQLIGERRLGVNCQLEQNLGARIVTPANPGSRPEQAPGSSLAFRMIESRVRGTGFRLPPE